MLSASIITITAVVVTGMADAVAGVVLGAAAGDGTVAAATRAADLTSSGGDYYE